MPTVSYPGVYIQELTSAVHSITGVATSIAAFVGYTARGIDNRAEQIFSFADYERLFGGLASDSELSYAVQQFFNNGGTQAWVVRTPKAGAAYAEVQFGTPTQLTFKALSSGAWANGELLIDLDYNGLAQPVTGSVTVSTTTVTGVGTFFKSALQAGQWLVFTSDTSQTPYQILSVGGDTSLTLVGTGYPGSITTPTTATVTDDPTAFNLTITNRVDNTVEPFPNVSLNVNNNNYLPNVVNDYDIGSQLVSVTVAQIVPGTSPTVPPVSGVVGSVVTVYGVNDALGGGTPTTVPGNVALTQYSPTVIGTGTSFSSAMIGLWLVFASDPTDTPYQVSSVNSPTSLTLASPYLGTTQAATSATAASTTASAAYGLSLSVSSPSAPSPFPITVPLVPLGNPLPQTMAGWAAQLQKSIYAAMTVQMPGAKASVQCSVYGVGNNQAIRINAFLPQIPDAVISFPALTSPVLTDASHALGLDALTVAPAVDNVAYYALGTGNVWGSQTLSSPGTDGTGPTGTTQLIGDPASFSGIYALQKVDIFNILCIPDATRALSVNSATLDSSVDPNAIYGAAIALCDSMRAFLLLDCPPYVTNIASAMDWKTSGLTVNDANGAAYFPRLRLADPLNNYNLRTFAPCGVVAGLYAQTDATRGVWKAPAGTEANLGGVQSLVYKMSDAENGVLNPLGLNCFRTFPVYGSVLWGARTLVGADAETNQWKYVPIRRVALFLESSLYQGTQWVVFEPNDEPLWSAIRLNVGSFMQSLFIQGYFQGSTPSQAYFVKCDSETTTQTDIDNGIVNIVVGFAPLYPAEFVIIQIQQMAGQTAS